MYFGVNEKIRREEEANTKNMSTSFNQFEVTGSGASGNNINSELAAPMFDKVLTPSDVGKLNRLVIPKVHAEHYFPLEDNQTCTTLDFQEPTGKMWRFRYAYWNSSQSYVMTKGWSRFIKEKNLQKEDIVSFSRGFFPDENDPEKQRKIMFIRWMHKSDIHRGDLHQYPPASSVPYPMGDYYPMTGYPIPHYRSFPPLYDNQFQERDLFLNGYGRVVNGGREHYYPEVGRETPLDHHHGRYEPLVYGSFPVFPRAWVAPLRQPPQAHEGVAATKKIRLFGVDMEESSSSSSGETMGLGGYSFASPAVIKEDMDQSSWRSPHGEMGASSSSLVMQLSDEEDYKRKGKKSLEF